MTTLKPILKPEDVLFAAHHIRLEQPKEQNALIKALDNKIVFVALKVIKIAALTAAVGVSIVATALFGFNGIPFLVVGAFVSVPFISKILERQFKAYHIDSNVQNYKTQAKEVYEAYEFLDQHACIGSNDDEHKATKERLRSDFIRPLTHLTSIHYDVKTLVTYQIVNEEDLASAVELETRYLSYPDTLAFYKKVISQINGKHDSYRLELKGKMLPSLTDKKKEYMDKVIPELNALGERALQGDYDSLSKWLEQSARFINERTFLASKNGVFEELTQEKQEQLNNLNAQFRENIKKYKESVRSKEKLLLSENRAVEKSSKFQKTRYADLFGHHLIFRQRNKLIEDVKAFKIQESKEKAAIEDRYRELLSPFEQNDQASIHYRDLKENELAKLADKTKAGLHNFIATLVGKDLEEVNADLEQSYEKLQKDLTSIQNNSKSALIAEKKTFMQTNTESIKAVIIKFTINEI